MVKKKGYFKELTAAGREKKEGKTMFYNNGEGYNSLLACKYRDLRLILNENSNQNGK